MNRIPQPVSKLGYLDRLLGDATMPRPTHEPTIPSDRDAQLAREASRVLGEVGTGDAGL